MLIPGQAFTPAQVLPHAGRMCLLDRIEDYGQDWLRAGLEVDGRGLFEDGQGAVPAWIGIEYMAQGVAAYAGIESLQAGHPVSIGMLIGTRRYEAAVPAFGIGWKLDVLVRLLLRDGDELAVFDCTLRQADRELARGDVKAFRPANIEEFMRTRR